MTRFLFFILPILVLSLTLLISFVAALDSSPECPLDPLTCNNPCACGGPNYGYCGKGYICGAEVDGWKCRLGSRYVGTPPFSLSSLRRLGLTRERGKGLRVIHLVLVRGGIGGINRVFEEVEGEEEEGVEEEAGEVGALREAAGEWGGGRLEDGIWVSKERYLRISTIQF